MNFIFIFGPQAVGKMTVGQELSRRTGYPFFYNHQTIDLANALYPPNEFERIKFLARLNFFTFKQYINHPSKNGLIYSDVWMLDSAYDCRLKHKMIELFIHSGWNVYLIELNASLDIRLKRNLTENRIKYKPSKMDVVASENSIINAETSHILNSINLKEFKIPEGVAGHLSICNDSLQPTEVVDRFFSISKFGEYNF